MSTPPLPFSRRRALACLLALACAQQAHAQEWNWTYLTGPDWEIGLTDAGYSDYLLDRTPTFGGREYLSGEWGAAVGYKVGGAAKSPTWLEPVFSFPDWPTNSDFGVVQPMTPGANNSDGLPTASSILANADLRVTQRIELVDTRTGTPMGLSPASAGSGAALMSNRYVMLQTYTIENISGQTVSDLRLFQLLHGLNSVSGVYDNRAYAGALSDYRYDVTLQGSDPYSGGGQYDYIGMHARVAPSAFEIGYFGVAGIDDHVSAKPGTGVHLSIENDSLSNLDSFAPPEQFWVAGGARWDLGTLNPGESRGMDVALTILTGWQVTPDDSGEASGSVNGGSDYPGGVDYTIWGLDDPGLLFVEYEAEDWDSLQELIAVGEIGPLSFRIPGDELQLYEIEFSGSFSDQIMLTLGYDPLLLPAGFDASLLRVFHWNGDAWEDLGGTVDPLNSTITFYADNLSPFAVGAVPEPGTYALLLAGLALVAWQVRRKAG